MHLVPISFSILDPTRSALVLLECTHNILVVTLTGDDGWGCEEEQEEEGNG